MSSMLSSAASQARAGRFWLPDPLYGPVAASGTGFFALVVCVTKNERYIMYAFLVHVVYSVTATATTDNFDDFR